MSSSIEMAASMDFVNLNDVTFKICPNCGTKFSMHDLIYNPEIKPIGITIGQTNIQSMFVFNHIKNNCNTTFAIQANTFTSLINEIIPPTIRFGLPECEGHCINLNDQIECQQNCKWAPYRRFFLSLMIIKNPNISKTYNRFFVNTVSY
jgi:hypothetical protein